MDEKKIVLENCPFCDVEAKKHQPKSIFVAAYWFDHVEDCILKGYGCLSYFTEKEPDRIRHWNTRAGR